MRRGTIGTNLVNTTSTCVSIDMWKWMPRDSVCGACRGANTISHLQSTLVLVNRYKMATKIMLSRKGTATASVVADVRLETIGVVGGHMSFEIECSGEC
jgi:hypothetical protein